MKQRLLIAERDAELCAIFRRFLTTRGYEVVTATDGLSCVAKLRETAPALLVLDVDLLWGGGDGVLSWLREERQAPGVPVLLTATAAHSTERTDFSAPPVVGLLPKPFALSSLFESVHSALAKGQ